MNFNQLRYIIAIDRFKNFTRAADHCQIAQSTLSKEVQRLELEFNTIIFDRSRTPVETTDKGKELMFIAQELLHKADEFSVTAKKEGNLPEGKFTLGLLSGLAPYILPLFIDKIANKYPSIQLLINEVGNHELDEMLATHQLDGAIGINSLKNSGYYESFLYEEEFILYVSPNHYLFAQDTIQFHEIPFHELTLHHDLTRLFKQHSINATTDKNLCSTKSYHFSKGSLETIRKIIDYSGGLSIFPKTMIHFLPHYKKNRIKFIKHPLMKHKVSFISPRFFQKERLIKVIKSEIIKSLKKH